MNRDLVAYSLSNTFAKKLPKSVDGHQNYSMPSQCRFLRHTVYQQQDAQLSPRDRAIRRVT